MAIYTGHNEDSSGNLLLSIGNGMTATVETGATASQAYAKGAYLYFNNKLCKATVAISSGANLVIGTNLAQTNIGTELTTHLRSSDANEFYFDIKDGKYGFYPTSSRTASEFVPFGGSTSPTPVLIARSAQSGSVNVSNYEYFRSFTVNNFVLRNLSYTSREGYHDTGRFSMSYNPSSGVLSYNMGCVIGAAALQDQWTTGYGHADIYLITTILE